MAKTAVKERKSAGKKGAVKHIAFTMVSVRDMARAREFYEGKLGLKLTKDYGGQWLEYHMNNNCFAITSMVKEVSPSASAGGVVAFEVDDLVGILASLRSDGVKILVEPYTTPGCIFAIASDPDGNGIMLHAKNKDRKD